MDDRRTYAEAVIERLRVLPGGRELLDLAAAREDVELIGGATRDLLLGRTPRELDVVVAADAPSFARDLSLALGLPAGGGPDEDTGVTVHERFGTAVVWWQAGRIDIAVRRAESYPAPGALPEVRAGTREEDLRRRDFTVNAIAVPLGRARRGELHAVTHALADLAGKRLRVLHEHSFFDDPTRLLRLARYLARLGFEPEERTAELAAEALAADALATVSGARVGAELRLALAEPDPVAALAALSELGVLAALHPPVHLDEALARAALEVLPEDGRPDLLLVGCLLLTVTTDLEADPESSMFGLLTEMEFTAGDRDRVMRTVLTAPGLAKELGTVGMPSELREAVHGVTLEAIALAASLGEGPAPTQAAAARQWLGELRHVRLTITGDDLLAAGIPAGPEIGHRLRSTLDMRLDGELDDTREAQLRAALGTGTRDSR
jgi:tRNA nucleotidyltransferase (CCA-adding enzyme)